MKSEKYRKYRRGKKTFKTHMIKGSGNTKGKTVVGSDAALRDIEQQLGRKLNVIKTDHTKDQWVFCEEKGSARNV